jgi:hypothetical protein
MRWIFFLTLCAVLFSAGCGDSPTSESGKPPPRRMMKPGEGTGSQPPKAP